MQRPMEGVRVLEVAQFTFVPAAGAVLADWGADVIHVEHHEAGDAQRGLVKVMGLDALTPGSTFYPIMEGPNRSKRSIGLDIEHPDGKEVLLELARSSDVFLTNFLPAARVRLGIELEDIRAVNPDIIYVRGSGFGNKGPEREKGGYDATAFWARGGSAAAVTPPEALNLADMPTGAYGDNMGGMTIAGGIAAALYGRQLTGEPSVVDVSLLSVGAWAMQFGANFSMMLGFAPPRPRPKHGSLTNPLIGAYRTADDRWLMLSMLQPGRYWPEFCAAAGRPELAEDPRFDSAERIMANAAEAAELVAEIIAGRPYEAWVEALAGTEGQWALAQDTYEVGHDVSLRANGYVQEVVDAEGVTRELIANPVQFDETPPSLRRAPQFAEHTDEILRELGRTDEQLIQLKIDGAVT